MRSGPRRLTEPSVRCATPYVEPTSASCCSPGWTSSSPTRANGRRGSSRWASTSSSAARFSSASIRLRYAPISSARISSSRPGGAADEQLPVLVGRLLERAADRLQEPALTRAQRRLVEGELDRARADPRAAHALDEVVGRPRHEPGVDRLREREAQVGDAARSRRSRRRARRRAGAAAPRRAGRSPPRAAAPRRARAAASPARASRSSPGAPPRPRRVPPGARAGTSSGRDSGRWSSSST